MKFTTDDPNAKNDPPKERGTKKEEENKERHGNLKAFLAGGIKAPGATKDTNVYTGDSSNNNIDIIPASHEPSNIVNTIAPLMNPSRAFENVIVDVDSNPV